MQLDTRIPMMAVGERLNPAGIMQQAAQFRQQQQAGELQQRLDSRLREMPTSWRVVSARAAAFMRRCNNQSAGLQPSWSRYR